MTFKVICNAYYAIYKENMLFSTDVFSFQLNKFDYKNVILLVSLKTIKIYVIFVIYF